MTHPVLQPTELKRDVRSREIAPTIIIDTREKIPFEFATLPSEIGSLDTADYSVKGLTHLVAVERKSLDDLLGCVGRERDRFKRELQRLRAYKFRLLVIETTAKELNLGRWCSRLTSSAVVGTLAAWIAQFSIPIWLSGSHESGAKFTELFLYQAARRVAEEAEAVRAIK